MGGIPSYLAVLLESGASTGPGKDADSRLIRYITQHYPGDAGVELVVNDLEDFRLMAKLAEPRLAVYLEEMAINIDCGLATKASENGKMIGALQREAQALVPKANAQNQDDKNFEQMNYSESKQDVGNKKY